MLSSAVGADGVNLFLHRDCMISFMTLQEEISCTVFLSFSYILRVRLNYEQMNGISIVLAQDYDALMQALVITCRFFHFFLDVLHVLP